MKRTLQSITCQICNEPHPSNGIHSHLKYKHNGMTTTRYIELYGDFRVNTKKAESLKEGKALYKCVVCNDLKTYTSTALSFHLKKEHELDKEEYILKYLLNGEQRFCKCGCNTHTKILWYHSPHTREYVSGHNKSTLGKVFSKESKEKMSISAIARLNKHSTQGTKPVIWTRKCVFERVYGDLSTYQTRMKERNITCLSSFEEICTDGIPLKFLCDVTKKPFEQISLDAVSPHSEKLKSAAQQELLNFVKSILPDDEILENTQKVLDNRKEIDIYIPSKKLGIEYNGLYYHSEISGKKDKYYHLWKTENAIEKGIKLVQIFEDEWINKNEIIKSKLKTLLGVINEKRIFARKCTVREISPEEKNMFLDTYHIQGADKSNTKLGLFFKDELVAVMTFSKPNVTKGKSKENFIELGRYATKFNVIGGAGKLLAHFKNYCKHGKIITYADRRWTSESENLYTKLGFRFLKKTQPNYFYTNGTQTRLHRFNFTKGKLLELGHSKDKSEWQIMQEIGYDRIWDCGHFKYEMVF